MGPHCLEQSTPISTEELQDQNIGIETPFVDDTLRKNVNKIEADGCIHSPCVHGVCVETTSQDYRCYCHPGKN